MLEECTKDLQKTALIFLAVVISTVNVLQIVPLFFLGSALIFIGVDLVFEWVRLKIHVCCSCWRRIEMTHHQSHHSLPSLLYAGSRSLSQGQYVVLIMASSQFQRCSLSRIFTVFPWMIDWPRSFFSQSIVCSWSRLWQFSFSE